MKYLKLKFLLMFFALAMAIPPAWAETVTATLTQSVLELTGSYSTNTQITVGGITYQHKDLMKNNQDIQAKASTGTIFNTTAYPGNITSVAITHSGTARATTISGSSDGTNWSQVATGSGSITGDFSGKGYKYFKITRGSNAAYWTKIEITYQSGTVLEQVATPTFSPAAGTYTEVQNVEINCETEGATIYYTTDGSTPTTTSTEYTGAITVNETMTLKAIAVKSGMDNSTVASATYTINLPVVPSGVIYKKVNSSNIKNGGTYVIIYEGDPAAAMGEIVTVPDNGTKGSSVTGIILDKTTTPHQVDLANKSALLLTARATNTEGRYAFEIGEGSYLKCKSASFDIADSYTNVTDAQWDVLGDGRVKSANTSSNRPIIYRAGNVNLFGPYASSNVNNTEYFYAYLYEKVDGSGVERVATPTFDPAGDAYDTPQSVTISCETPNSTIYFTTDGTDPTESSTLYNGAIEVNETMTIKAIAVADDMENSLVATATYTLPKFVANLTAANALPDNTNFKYTKDVVVVYRKNAQMWIQDKDGTEGGGFVYTSGLTFSQSDVINANWTAKKIKYSTNNTEYPEFTEFVGTASSTTQTPIAIERSALSTDNIHEYVLLKNVTISDDLYVTLGRAQLQLYTSKLGEEEDFKPVSGKTYNVKGLVGTYQGNLQIYPIEITEYVAPGQPSINVEPTELILKEPATGTFNVTGENLVDNVGCPNENHVFNTTYTGGEIWGFNQDANHEVNGTVTVTYTGRELTATDIFYAGTKKSWNPQVEISIPVTVTYQPDIWLYGNFGDGNWVYGNKMEYSDGIYSVNFTTTAETFLLFAKKADETYNWDTNRLFFGPKTDGDNWLLNSIFEDDLDLNGIKNKNNDNVQYHPIQLPIAGEYTITINPTTKRFTISRGVQQVAKPVIAPEGGEYNTIQTVTITCETEGAVIHYTTDGTVPDANSPVYSDVITVDHTMTIKAIAVADGMDNSEMASETYTLPESVKTLAAANALDAGTEFLFTGDVVVTYANGDYIWLRDKDATAGGGLFYQTNLNLTQGAVLNKGWSAKRQDYRGEKEFINAANVTNSGNTASFAPFDRTGSPLDVANMNEYIKLDNVKITGKTLDEQSGKFTYTGQYGSESKDVVNYILHNQFDLTGIEEGKTYNVVGTVIQYDDNTEVYPTEITPVQVDPGLAFSEETVNATYGAAFTAPELTKPDDLTVTYESSNTNVATVDQNTGAVTIVGVGNAKITASSTETTYYLAGEAFYNIVVAAATPTFEYSAATKEVVFGSENPELPTLNNPNGLTVSYESTNTAVATVANDGVVTIVGAGTTIIKATGAATGNYSGAEAQYTLTVNKADIEVSFNNETPDPITIGDVFTAPTLSEVPEGTTVNYKSSNENVAKVNATTGEVEIVGIGTAVITATVTGDNYNETSASYTITVKDVEEAVATPTFAPAAGTYTEPKEVAIACATPGVTIEYTIDGVTKTYDGPFTVDHNCTVTATASKGSKVVYNDSQASATYVINAAPAAGIEDGYYSLQNNAEEVAGKYANVAGRRTLNFVADPDDKAGTIFRIKTDPDTVGQIETLRSQAVDLQGYANRAMAYVPKVIDLVLSTLANSSLGDPETPGEGILGENGVQLILKKFYEKFDYNLYVEGTEGAYRIYGRTPSMQHVVDFYHENTAQVEEKLPMLEDYINQVLDKIRNKIPAPYDPNVVVPFSLKTVRDRIADKYGITLIDPTQDLMGFYRQVLNNKEYVWDFAYQTAMMYVDVIKQTGTYQSLPNEYKLLVQKMEKVRPDTKYYIIERGNELDYISENNGEIISNDPRTFWKLTKRENFTVNVPEANKLNDSYYTTLYTDFGYELPADVKAYAVTGIDENDVAQLTEITDGIPAQTPVLLKADAAGDKVLTLKKESRGGAIEGNLLEGPDYLINKYQFEAPTVVTLFSMAEGFVPADVLDEYSYLKLRNSGTVNNKYFWNVNSDLENITGINVLRSLSTNTGKLAFSDDSMTETNKAFMVSETEPVIYLSIDTVATPTLSLVAGSYTGEQTLNISCATDDATISYSTDGGKNWTEGTSVTLTDDCTVMVKAEKEGMIPSEVVTAEYIIDEATVLPDVPAMKGYYQIKNNENEMYANVAGRRTLNFKSETEAESNAGTIFYLETNGKGQVQSLRSQGVDLQGYANRAMHYVPDMVQLVVNTLHAEGAGTGILGENGLDEIMAKFNECFDYHLYVEPVGDSWRIYGKTPSMQHVVDFYRAHTAQVEAKLPMLEDFINDALTKLRNKIGGETVFTPFSLHQIWENMGGNLPEPVVGDDAAIMDFYRAVLNNKNYVWDFAYQTAQIYWNNVKRHPRYNELKAQLGEYADYIDEFVNQVRPDFKYYIIQRGNEPDYISEGNAEINDARSLWTLEPRETFKLSSAGELFGCPLATTGVGGYFTTNYTDFAYTLPDGVTAYKVTDVDADGEAVLEVLTGTIPAQTPVLLVAKEDGEYEVTLTTDAGTAVSGNLLQGPDYLITLYQFKTQMVVDLFSFAQGILGDDLYNTYVAPYEYLQLRYSGTVNNKYFWNVNSDIENITGTNVIRSLSTETGELAFSDNTKTEDNKAFMVSEDLDVIKLPGTLRGDVNHDGAVNIQDVTDLIDRLLENNFVACPYCSDVNEDTGINIQDVTDLIDILLSDDGSTTNP